MTLQRGCGKTDKMLSQGSIFHSFIVHTPLFYLYGDLSRDRTKSTDTEKSVLEKLFYCSDCAVAISRIGNFITNARQIGNGILSVNRLIVINTQSKHIGHHSIDIIFVNNKIGDCTFHMQRSSCNNRAATDMNLYSCFVCTGQVADFFYFGNATAGSKIRLNDLNSLPLQMFLELPPGVNPFPTGHRNSGLTMYVTQQIRMRCSQFFKIQNAVFFGHITELNRRLCIGIAMVFQNNIYIWTMASRVAAIRASDVFMYCGLRNAVCSVMG